MSWYIINSVGTVHEQYVVEAENVEEARRKWENGELPLPRTSWVDDAELVNIEETS